MAKKQKQCQAGGWYRGTIMLSKSYLWEGVFRCMGNQVDGEFYYIGFKDKHMLFMTPDYEIFKVQNVEELTPEQAYEALKELEVL